MGSTSIQDIPNDILLQIILYLDIPSLGAVAQTSKPRNGSISQLVISEKIWFDMSKLRFNLMKTAICRSKLYGGRTWKDAYRSMSVANRIPKSRVFFKKKAILAKGSGSLPRADNDTNKCNEDNMDRSQLCISSIFSDHNDDIMLTRKKPPNPKTQHKAQFLQTWVMVNHTEDCNLRVSTANNYNSEVDFIPHIELQVAYQNTKSGFCTVDVDVSQTSVNMLCKDEYGGTSYLTLGVTKPRVLYRSIGSNVLYQDNGPRKRRSTSYGKKSNEVENFTRRSEDLSKSGLASFPLSLSPFEFVIVSMNVPLTHYINIGESLRFETDFLSRALSLWSPFCIQSNEFDLLEETENESPLLAVASFICETEIWDVYTPLPGNCLTLKDTSSFSTV
jgi:hypothetical protein